MTPDIRIWVVPAGEKFVGTFSFDGGRHRECGHHHRVEQRARECAGIRARAIARDR